MRDFPSCFGENGIQVADASSSSSNDPLSNTNPTNKITQNLVTCVYKCKLHTFTSFIITITWNKTLMGQGLSVEINNPTNKSLCKLDIKPWLFSKQRGFKNLEVGPSTFDVFWDLSNAKFGSSPEPLSLFYLAITVNQELVLLLGDMEKEVYKKLSSSSCSSPNFVFISKKEHIFGKKMYTTKAQFCGKGQVHDILIECDTISTNDPCLLIRIDGKMVMQVKHLRWKFRGNYTILVDGLPVEVYWDVHSWFFGGLVGGGVFLFQSCLSAEKLWGLDHSWSSLMVKDSQKSQGLGFSLVLCAWKNE